MTLTLSNLEGVRARMQAALAARLGEHLGRLDWDADRLALHQRDRLRELLAHALARSPFHAERLAGVDPTRFELHDLARLPTMTKAQMMSRFDDVVTDRRLRRHLVEAHLAASSVHPALLLDEYVCLASGGSSGERGVFVQALDAFADFGASIMRAGAARARAAGSSPSQPMQLVLVAAASPVHATGFAAATVTDGPVRLLSVPATLPLSEIVQRLNAIQPLAVLGYPSVLARLAAEQRAGRLRIAPRSVTAASEQLTPEDREAIAAGFGTPPFENFASTEGLVGHGDGGDGVLTLVGDMCLAELVDEHNRPVAPGAPAAKVLVTNLFNVTQPLIRYELTDRFIGRSIASNGQLRVAVDGRADEVFRYGGVDVHPHVIRSVLVQEPAVGEYQVHQTPDGVGVRVVVSGPIDAEQLAGHLRRDLGRAGLPAPRATVEVVDEIARHPETGKLRRFVALGGAGGTGGTGGTGGAGGAGAAGGAQGTKRTS